MSEQECTSNSWRKVRLRFVASIRNSNVDKKSYENQERVLLCNYTDVYYNECITSKEGLMEATASQLEIDKFELLAGDVIITKDSETADDIGIPAWVPESLPGVVCGYHLTQLRAHANILPEFLFRSLQAITTRQYLEAETPGVTRFGLDQDTIGSIPIRIPNIDVQRVVCIYLDRSTKRIDALVAKKTRFIELLREKRQAVITHAVTKGLDAAAPMKDSGVEWLGNVPEAWTVAPLKRLVHFQRGHDLPADYRRDGDIPVVSSGGIIGYHSKAAATGPGIVTGRYGSIGEFSLVETDYWPLNTSLFSKSLNGNVPRFVWYLLHSISDLFVLESNKSAVPGIDRNDVHRILVAFPHVEEQEGIVAFLDKVVTHIDTLIAKTERSIELLREHRTALITAAVTGKIDLREAA